MSEASGLLIPSRRLPGMTRAGVSLGSDFGGPFRPERRSLRGPRSGRLCLEQAKQRSVTVGEQLRPVADDGWGT
jgi:hypothetical protein